MPYPYAGRDVLGMLFVCMLGADEVRSMVVGETESECQAFCSLCLGRLDAQLQPILLLTRKH